jgi:hypothetical protein
MKTHGIGTVLPPGMAKPAASLPAGRCEVRILSHTTDGGDGTYAACEYPDGFVKEHQAKELSDLLPRVVTVLRSRYGVHTAAFVTTPADLSGGIIILEVTNGPEV